MKFLNGLEQDLLENFDSKGITKSDLLYLLHAISLLRETSRLQIKSLYQIEHDRIQELVNSGKDLIQIATDLGIGRATLYRKIKSLGVIT